MTSHDVAIPRRVSARFGPKLRDVALLLDTDLVAIPRRVSARFRHGIADEDIAETPPMSQSPAGSQLDSDCNSPRPLAEAILRDVAIPRRVSARFRPGGPVSVAEERCSGRNPPQGLSSIPTWRYVPSGPWRTSSRNPPQGLSSIPTSRNPGDRHVRCQDVAIPRRVSARFRRSKNHEAIKSYNHCRNPPQGLSSIPT